MHIAVYIILSIFITNGSPNAFNSAVAIIILHIAHWNHSDGVWLRSCVWNDEEEKKNTFNAILIEDLYPFWPSSSNVGLQCDAFIFWIGAVWQSRFNGGHQRMWFINYRMRMCTVRHIESPRSVSKWPHVIIEHCTCSDINNEFVGISVFLNIHTYRLPVTGCTAVRADNTCCAHTNEFRSTIFISCWKQIKIGVCFNFTCGDELN